MFPTNDEIRERAREAYYPTSVEQILREKQLFDHALEFSEDLIDDRKDSDASIDQKMH